MNPSILKSALISEKSFSSAALGKFTFIVDKNARKEDIIKAAENLFDINVLDVHIINVVGKVKRGKKGLGKRSDYKKAILTLKKGQKIDLFETEKEDDKGKKPKAESKKEVKAEGSADTTVKVREKKK